MFEKILENILKNYLGTFINDLDQNHLSIGVWSGDVIIENVSLKEEIFKKFDIPIKLKYSNIGI